MFATSFPAMSPAEAHARLVAPGSRFEMDEVTIRGISPRVRKHAPGTLRDVLAIGKILKAEFKSTIGDERLR